MKNLIVGVCIAMFGLNAVAQEQQKKELSPEEIAAKRIEHLKTELELNSVQVETIKAAMVSNLTKVKEVKEKHKGDKEAMKKAIEPIRMEFIDFMKKTLTDTQYAKWKEMEHGRKHHKSRNHAVKMKKSGEVAPNQNLEQK